MKIALLGLLFWLVPILSFGNGLTSEDERYECVERTVFPQIPDAQFVQSAGYSKSEFMQKIRDKGSIIAISESTFNGLLDRLSNYIPILCLRQVVEEEVSGLRGFRDDVDYISKIVMLEKRMDQIDQRMSIYVDVKYLEYKNPEVSNSWIKGVNIYHDNDFFLMSKINTDRDYTGGVRIEFTTDKLKLKLFRALKPFDKRDRYLSYQSFLIGGEGYTPYIRFTEEELGTRNVIFVIDDETQFLTPESEASIQEYMRSNQQLTDRPFASFQYFGRGVYRLHHTGKFRISSYFKVGKIGGLIGKNVQAVLHQDFTTGSQRVLNWEDQIANGGRWAFNIEHKFDLSIFSLHSLTVGPRNIRKFLESRFLNNLLDNTNIYIPFEVAIGTANTHAGLGIGYSNRSFPNTNGINSPKLFDYELANLGALIWRNTFIGLEYNYRHVFHNSMLEGIGLFNRFKDDPLDDEAVTVYSLDSESVERNLHTINAQVGIRLNNVVLYYKHVRFANEEFKVKIDDNTQSFNEFRTRKWYGYGRLGFNLIF